MYRDTPNDDRARDSDSVAPSEYEPRAHDSEWRRVVSMENTNEFVRSLTWRIKEPHRAHIDLTNDVSSTSTGHDKTNAVCNGARKSETARARTRPPAARRLERDLGILAVARMKVDSAETEMAEVAVPSIFKCQPSRCRSSVRAK